MRNLANAGNVAHGDVKKTLQYMLPEKSKEYIAKLAEVISPKTNKKPEMSRQGYKNKKKMNQM